VGVLPLNQFVGSGTIDVAAYKSPDLPGGWPAKRILPTEVSGSYNNSKNLINAHLKGIDEGKGSDLTVKFEPGSIFPTKMNGKVLGQKIKWQIP
jgi:hypothetical protein